LVVFGWSAGWNLLYRPTSNDEIQEFRNNPKYEKTWKLIHRMLQVSFEIIFLKLKYCFHFRLIPKIDWILTMSLMIWMKSENPLPAGI